MSLNLTPSDPRNAEWIALRNKQITELQNFQNEVKAAKAKFFKDIEKKREDLIATHQREKNGLLNNEQANSSGTVLPKKSGDRPRQTPASTSKTSPYTSTPQTRLKPQSLRVEKMCCHSHRGTWESNRELAPPLLIMRMFLQIKQNVTQLHYHKEILRCQIEMGL
ncbi:hypothetical protein COCCADRAFT_88388 [Bipolaris zeicola 26-R-13]|uniref:Uncharacterized protein n=1 Tax=Cochliobolus carbonum (strain 26-R-13) TaxID=930089 RepID=W6YY96_COCC2|nr:uncharacterized protein COCCADRAFT_88388 [Bipolaris zeicola 26-R-13]EUC36421.1 hypothetical protein COCCADRAFT_88388 [Bipolaris zeicola 26-R-13]